MASDPPVSIVTPTTSATDDIPWPSVARRWGVIAIICLVVILSNIDRYIFSLLVDPIRQDLGISDTQISLIGGTAFGLMYAFCALPFGHLADRRSRVAIISMGVLFWSAMTTLCGFAKSFYHLLLARMGVGAGEACLAPSAASLIADYFPPARLPVAMAVFVAAGLCGSSIALITGGWIVSLASQAGALHLPLIGLLKPWQLCFVLVGLPGLLVAAIVLLIPEPVRRRGMRTGNAKAKPVRIADTLAFIGRRAKVLILHNLGFAMVGMFGAGMFFWAPSFFHRTFDWTTAEGGHRFGLMVLICGVPGAYFGGWISSFLMSRKHEGAVMQVAFGSTLLLLPVAVAAPLMPTASAALVMFGLALFLFCVPAALTQSALQLVVPNEARGQISAMFNVVSNLIGFGLGPTMVALCNDFVFHDEAMLRYSMAIVSGLSLLAAATCLGLCRAPFLRAVRLAAQGLFEARG